MLHLDEPSHELMERYHSGGLSESDLGAHPLLARWRRVTALGLSPDGPAFAEGTGGLDLATRRERLESFFREETPLLAPMAEELSASSMVAIITDQDGVILHTRGGGDFVTEAMRVRLSDGACWSEEARGTNAIGTAIAEKKSVAVIGRAHYEVRNQGLFCYGTPIFDPFGELCAVLDVSGAVARNSSAVGLAVQAAGAALERSLRLRAYAAATVGGYAVLERMLHRCASPAVLIEANGELRAMNEPGRALLGVDLAAGRMPRRILGTSTLELVAAARRPGARVETGRGGYRVELEPILDPLGRLLAVTAYFEPIRVKKAVRARPARAALPAGETGPRLPAVFSQILGNDQALIEAKVTAARFAATSLPVLLLAETGAGKELFARAVHGASARAAGPFVALSCAGMAPTLLESELFGHAPSAFTDAGSEGKIAAAAGGTLFLDEIAELPEALQASLLRVLEGGVYDRMGEAVPRRSDFRLICATSRDLPALVQAGAFRPDLYFRIQGATVTIPPLRKRSDRLALARGLLARLVEELGADGSRPRRGPPPELDAGAEAFVLEHDWPGNVRELRTALAHALVLAGEEEELRREHFPAVLISRPVAAVSEGARTRDEILRAAVDDALKESGGNVSQAARRLGVARSTLYRMRPKRLG